jgi:hypothetical protein
MSADFSYSTVPVASDRSVDIVASILGRSRSASLSIWAVLPTFFSYTTDRGLSGYEQLGRYVPESATFSASCRDSGVSAGVTVPSRDDRPWWSIMVAAPRGVPLRRGVYENATDTIGGNFLYVSGASPFCRSMGRFTVHDVDVEPHGLVNRLWITFERTCAGQPGTLRGDLRLTNPQHSKLSFGPCLK